ncbi:MAG: alkaline phosphatase family protein [Candidatus Woesearchaeota archaeon]|nr:alkaline phosphatase family protein [Candidatus Woesearchaeota archaeon]
MLIIIDQLRADYAEHLKKCSDILPYPAVCDTYSFPASTEAMHTNISTGKYPNLHGFTSKIAKNNLSGLEQLIEKLRNIELPSLALLGISNNFKVYAIGGKEETVRVMGHDTDCELLAYYNKEKSKDRFVYNTQNLLIGQFLDYLFNTCHYKRVPQQGWDKRALDIFNNINSLDDNEKRFFILTLSSLDKIGHDYGPHSEEVYNHLSFLDESISAIIRDMPDSPVIITGDHGCRHTTRYLIEPSKENPQSIAVYNVAEDYIKFENEYLLKSFEDIKDIQYDGGILRIWLNSGKNLCESDLNFLSEHGYVFPHYINQGHADYELIQLYENSRHENLGDIFVVAKGDTTFCKLGWITDTETKGNIKRRRDLILGNLPIGEHGTYHDEDRKVGFLSNLSTINQTLKNTEIYSIIETIMNNSFHQ